MYETMILLLLLLASHGDCRGTGTPSAPKLISKNATSFVLESSYKNVSGQNSMTSAIFECNTIIEKVLLSENQETFNATISGLKDFTNYTCTVRVNNFNYSSEKSSESTFETNEKLSGPPDFSVISQQSKSLSIRWNILKGRIQNYKIRIIKINKNYALRKGCGDSSYNKSFAIRGNESRYKILNLDPFTKYSIEMATENTAGVGVWGGKIESVTKPATPYRVNDFKCSIDLNFKVNLTWELPCEINGEFIAVKGIFYESQIHEPHVNVTKIYWDMKSLSSQRVKPEHFYNVTIWIEINNFTGPLNETSCTVESLAGIPAAYASSKWGQISKAPVPRDHVKLTINKTDFLSKVNGTIRNFTFLVSERYCQVTPTPNSKIYRESDETKLKSWFDVENDKCTGQYQIQVFTNNDTINEGNSLEFIIGNEKCDKTVKKLPYCNGPLKSGTKYIIMGRVFTSNSYGDTKPIVFETEKCFLIITIIIISCILISGLFVGLGIAWCKSNKVDKKKPSTLIEPETPKTEKVQIEPYFKYVSLLQPEINVITEEYRSIEAMDLSDLSTEAAERYQWKNRYTNILPYDQNRVYLMQNTYCQTDYINASFINGYTRPDEYIATQGPKVDTCYDFWNMIIEKNCQTIFMLTKLVERGIIKCAQYYPNQNADLQFYDILVTNVDQVDLTLCKRRKIKVTKGIVERLIVQYHFEKWSDHCTLENELDLIELTEMVRLEDRNSVLNAPIVVHCSAGVGRTGTLIAMDILMQHIENDKMCNVCETVKGLRYDRVKMVQTLEQYIFLYKSVARYLRKKWPNIEAN